MARFAYDCMIRMRDITKDLETQLGPDTSDLTMRFGLNSGKCGSGMTSVRGTIIVIRH